MKEKIEMLKHIIGRYDHYYDSINNKASVFLTLNTFLLGGIVTVYYSIKNQLDSKFSVLFLLVIALCMCLASIFYSLFATLPYLSKQADSINGSVIYFSNVANVSLQSFKQMFNDLTDETQYQDYLQQVHLLASGLDRKFQKLKIATYLLGGCFVCIIIIGIKILN